MTEQSTKKEYNSFIAGIITEAGPLTFPENASLDEANMVLNRDGSRQRRLGMDFESDYILRTVTFVEDDAVGSFRWKNVANNPSTNFAVVQVGKKLLVFYITAGSPSISANLVATLDISLYTTGKTVIGASSGMGYFFVTGGVTDPFYLSFDTDTSFISLTPFHLNIRDTFGVEDGLETSESPAGISTPHRYNLRNQGWNDSQIAYYMSISGGFAPTNSQQWFVGKDSNDDFDPALLGKHDFGSTPAPRGRFVIDAFARSQSRLNQTGLTTDPDMETGYPTVVNFAFERVWYAGMQSDFSGASEYHPNYTGFVFYSRTLRSAKDFGQCYSDADPTSEIDSDLVDTDGGYINIPESGVIYALVQKGSSMIVFAEHGIWEIGGGDFGFTGTQHSVFKITEFGAMSPTSIVDAETAVVYWNRGGIYVLAPDPESGRLVSTNVSERTIQTLYNEIDMRAKYNAVGSFDKVNRRISWMYNNSGDAYDGVNFRNKYDSELVYDMVLSAFYKSTLGSIEVNSPYIAGSVETNDFLRRAEGVRTRGDSVNKYLVFQYTNPPANEAVVTFGYYRDPTFRDWKSADGEGVSFNSYVITGHEIMGDSVRTKSTPYLVMHFKRTELVTVENEALEIVAGNPSSCMVSARWEWSNSPDSGKWGEEFQAYRLHRPYTLPSTEGEEIVYPSDVITTKNRLRGSGKALSLYIRSDEDKDFYLYGWATRWEGKSHV